MEAPYRDYAAPFTIEFNARDGVPIVVIGGEIDSSNAEEIGDYISVQLKLRPPILAVDLQGIRFIGSSGVRVLLEHHLRANSVGTRLVVIADHSTVLRPLQVTKLDQVLELHPAFPQLREHDSGRSVSSTGSSKRAAG